MIFDEKRACNYAGSFFMDCLAVYAADFGVDHAVLSAVGPHQRDVADMHRAGWRICDGDASIQLITDNTCDKDALLDLQAQGVKVIKV